MSVKAIDKTQHKLAEYYREHGDCDRAEMIYKTLLSKACKGQSSMLEKTNHAEIAALTSGLANVYTTAQDFDKALPLLKKAVRVNKQVHGNASHHLTVPYHNIGEIYRQKKDYASAEKWLKMSAKNAVAKNLYPGPKDYQGEKDTYLALESCYRKRRMHQHANEAQTKAGTCEQNWTQVPARSGQHHHMGTTSASMPNFRMMQQQVKEWRQACLQVQIPTEREVIMRQNVNSKLKTRAHTADAAFRPAMYVRTEPVLQQSLREKARDRRKQKRKDNHSAKPRLPRPKIRKDASSLNCDVLVREALRNGMDDLVQLLTLYPHHAELAQLVKRDVM